MLHYYTFWETSGHWQHYSNNMFTFDIEKDTFALGCLLKP